jgi:DNA-binding transcriptional regulator/RsmH inhibitor MraZ
VKRFRGRRAFTPCRWAESAEAGRHPSAARPAGILTASYYGQTSEIDTQGRVVIHPRLRESAGMIGEVDVFGQYEYLDVWNHERFTAKLQREPYNDDDARALADFGI